MAEQQRSILKPSTVGGEENGQPTPITTATTATTIATSSQQPPQFRVDLKYRNQLPQIPFEPKFLDLDMLNSGFLYQFNPQGSSLERNYKYRIHMNPPPAMVGDLVDVFGNEEWARCTELDDRDRALLRKEGQALTSSRNNRQNVSKKSWMLKTYYTQNNVYVPNKSTSPQPVTAGMQNGGDSQDGDGEEEEEEEVFKLVAKIDRQFQHAKQMQQTNQVPGSTKPVKRVLALMPNRLLRELDLHLVRFKVGENTGVIPNCPAVLAKRKDKFSPHPFSPLALLVGEGGEKEDDDLFADEDEENEKTDKVHHLRDYQVETMAQTKRVALFVGESKVAKFVELHDDALKLFRLANSTHRRRHLHDAEDEDDAQQLEANVKLHVRQQLTEDELEDRKRRRIDIEGEDD
ncbi:hypothetical protein BASA81_012404 [Batrachochytrium salamandrivorans]|nr:hypothetical protein BASA81_012404 [Batrachochytrium salamandrivorans]